jgi:hypothetical protein
MEVHGRKRAKLFSRQNSIDSTPIQRNTGSSCSRTIRSILTDAIKRAPSFQTGGSPFCRTVFTFISPGTTTIWNISKLRIHEEPDGRLPLSYQAQVGRFTKSGATAGVPSPAALQGSSTFALSKIAPRCASSVWKRIRSLKQRESFTLSYGILPLAPSQSQRSSTQSLASNRPLF